MIRTITFLLLLTPFTLLAQFSPKPITSPASNQGAFLDLQAQYYEWAASHDLDSTKGWKWYARWAHDMESRLNGDGTIPHANLLYEGAVQVSRMKQQSPASRQANWSPTGPDDLPFSPDPNDIFGMGRVNTIAFHPTDSNTFWAGVAQGGLWKTTNHGQSWLPLTDDLPILRISDIAVDPQHPDTMFISVGDYAYLGISLDLDDRNRHTHYGIGVYKTTDGGATWTPTGLNFQQMQRDGSLTRRVFIDDTDANELVAAGIHGLWKSYNGGDTWTQKLDSLIWDIERDPTQPNTLYASSGYVHTLQSGAAAILKSVDFGETWTVLNTGIPAREVQRVEIAISSNDPNYVYALGCDLEDGFHSLWRSTDGGNSWMTRSSYAQDSVNILHWGTGRKAIGGQGTYDLVLLVDPNDKQRVTVGGVNLWGSADGGQTWGAVSYWQGRYGPSVHADQHFLTVNPLDQFFYLCNDGGVSRTKAIQIGSWDSVFTNPNYNWPTQWEDISSGLQIRSFYRVGISEGNPDLLVAGAQDNGTAFKDQSGNWTNATGGDGMNCLLHPTDPDIMYTSSQYGNLYRSTDGGQFFDWLSRDIRITNNDQGEWTTPFQLMPGDPSRMIAGFGQVWLSDNAGDNWRVASNFSPMQGALVSSPASALRVAPSDTQTFYVAKRIYHSFNQPSELWRTHDGGKNWTNITAGLPDSLYITSLTVDDDDQFRIWVCIKGFTNGVKVFQSINGGDTWQNISLNLPNISTNCIVHEPGSPVNTVYVGMDVGIFYYSDTSSAWTLYADGLPNVVVSDLDINLTTGKLHAATFGRGAWVSDLAGVAASVEKKILDDASITLYPNPNHGTFKLGIKNLTVPSVNVEIVDIMGRPVYQSLLRSISGSLEEAIDLELGYGLYFLKVSHEKATRVVRFVVK